MTTSLKSFRISYNPSRLGGAIQMREMLNPSPDSTCRRALIAIEKRMILGDGNAVLRRSFMNVLGVSVSLLGLTECGFKQPRSRIPCKPLKIFT